MISTEEAQKNGSKFKELCQQKLKRQPPMHLCPFIQGSALNIELDMLSKEEIDFMEVMLSLTYISIKLQGCFMKEADKKPQVSSVLRPKGNLNQAGQRQLFRLLSKHLEASAKLKTLTIEHVEVTERQLSELRQGIDSSRSVKELIARFCCLTDKHIEPLVRSLCNNKSLLTLNFSHNMLQDCGECFGKILSQHCQRRNQKIWFCGLRGELPEEDVSTEGICEVNLQANQLSDHAVTQLMKFLKFDNWTRSMNLKKNLINKEGIKQFQILMRHNTSLISLDLRDNPGFDHQSSRLIFKKLVKNIKKFKKYKEEYGKKREQRSRISRNRSPSKSSVRKHSVSVLDGKKKQLRRIEPGQAGQSSVQVQDNIKQPNCENCRKNHIKLLQVEQNNINLMIENRRLRMLIQPRNIEISGINSLPPGLPPQVIPQLEELSLNLRNFLTNDHSDDMLSRIQYVLAELTKIIEGGEAPHQVTNTIISNPLSMSHTNMSNTVQILATGERSRVLQHPDISNIQ